MRHTGLSGAGDAEVQHVRGLAGLFARGGHVRMRTGKACKTDLHRFSTLVSLQLGLRRHYVHPARGLPAFLASQADGDATQYNGG